MSRFALAGTLALVASPLTVSTHYPSSVKADDGSRLFYQQEVLATISRADIGN